MNEPEPVRVETEIAEFAAILATGHGEEAPVVVGGHAVNLWSEYYLSKGVETLARYVPFTSRWGGQPWMLVLLIVVIFPPVVAIRKVWSRAWSGSDVVPIWLSIAPALLIRR